MHFAYFYGIGGIVFIALYGYLADADVARLIAFNWLAVGIALLLILYGRSNRHASDAAGLAYLAGLALLIIFLLYGGFQIWNMDLDWQQLYISPD